MKVLLVEDNVTVADAIAELFELSNFQVVHAATVDDALDIVDSHRIDVAMLDINVGDRNVYEVASRLGRLQVPFLFASGSDPAQVPDEFGSRPFFAKPYDFSSILRSMHELLPGMKSWH